MDNHYVPNLTIGPLVCEAIRPLTQATIDVHLMVKPVDRIIPDFAKAGANVITFHPEASEHIDRSLSLIRESGCKAGLVFNPATPLDFMDHVMDRLDIVLLDVGQSGLRRPEVHPGDAQQAPAGARRGSTPTGRRPGAKSCSRSTAASRSTTSPRSPGPAPTPSSPARPSSAPARTAIRTATTASSMRCARNCKKPEDMSFPIPVRSITLDLDGTLLDTVPDLTAAANAMLLELGLPAREEREIRDFVGRGIANLVLRCLTRTAPPPAEEHARALAAFTRHYARVNGLASRPFPGVIEGLESFRRMGLKMAVITNKAAAFTEPLLAAMGLSPYIEFAVSGDTLAERKPAPAAAALCLRTPGHESRRQPAHRRLQARCRRRPRRRLPGILRALRLQRGRGRAQTRLRCYSCVARRGGQNDKSGRRRLTHGMLHMNLQTTKKASLEAWPWRLF